ncbi:hypothetical protein DY000_02023841 [Brassica cretica]|uniref:Uncharacterized protein n=1 Tax=Brassica cretica TaxID=69181 RepID=A0ABQ7ENI3_BRACR|nr:hypothetical protein DY000_02023841 [Brassica cretica]
MAATKIFFRSGFGYAGFSDLEDFWARRLPDNFEEIFQTTSRKVFRWSLLPCLPFITDLSVLVFNQMVLIFYLDMYFVYLGMIYMFFLSGSDFGRFMGSLLRSLLKYNVLDDFQEVFQTTSKKSSDGVFFHIKWSLSLSL